MDHIPVESSNIASIGYEPEVLEVTFKSGDTFRYPGVPEELAGAFMNSDSKGQFFARFIRPMYQGERAA
jgi:hypothetical protein